MAAQTSPNHSSHELAGTARLRIVAVASALSFLGPSLLEYALPLYFPAKGLPAAAWETWCLRTIFAWMLGPLFAAFIAARLGERRAWALGLAGYLPLPLMLWAIPSTGPWSRWMLDLASLWYGAVAALIWIGGISLAQIVPPSRRSLSNAATMVSVALGAIVAPQLGRLVLHLATHGQTPQPEHFTGIFVLYGVVSLLGSILVFGWGQRACGPDDNGAACAADRPRASVRASLGLLRSKRFVATVVALGLCTGPVFQATNAYRAYRAAEPGIGLIVGSADHGFAVLQSAGYVAQLLGGLLIALMAGRAANRLTGALILGVFTIFQLVLGVAPHPALLIAFSALFEMMRQCVRWSQTGFISELVPDEHRAGAISITVMLSGLGGWLFMVVMRAWQMPGDANFSTHLPFYVATVSGAVGVAILLLTHRAVHAARPGGTGS